MELIMILRSITALGLILGIGGTVAAQTKPPAAKAPQEKSQPVQPAPAVSAPVSSGDPLKDGLSSLEAKNYEAALKAFNEAYSTGKPDGAFYLGRMLELGVGL